MASSEIEELKMEISRLKAQNSEGGSHIQTIKSECKQIISSINEAKAQVKDLTVFDPENLAFLRQEYSLLSFTHLWRPVYFRGMTMQWVYDGILFLKLDERDGIFHATISFLDEIFVI